MIADFEYLLFQWS